MRPSRFSQSTRVLQWGRPQTGAFNVRARDKPARVSFLSENVASTLPGVGDAKLVASKFLNNRVTKPKLVPLAVPEALTTGKSLLTPADRRSILRYEVERQTANRLRRKASNERSRLETIMLRRYPEGLNGVDGPNTSATSVYASKAQARAERQRRAQTAAVARRDHLTRWKCSNARRGYSVIEHSSKPPEVDDVGFTRKAGRPPKMNTFSRLFDKPHRPHHEHRASMLKAQDRRGNPANIVGGHAW